VNRDRRGRGGALTSVYKSRCASVQTDSRQRLNRDGGTQLGVGDDREFGQLSAEDLAHRISSARSEEDRGKTAIQAGDVSPNLVQESLLFSDGKRRRRARIERGPGAAEALFDGGGDEQNGPAVLTAGELVREVRLETGSHEFQYLTPLGR
jgi:hypothetical protein